MYKDSVFRLGGALTSDVHSYCLLMFPESLEEMPQSEEDLHLSHLNVNSN